MTNKTKPQTHTPGPWTASADNYIKGPAGFGALAKVYSDGFARNLSSIQGTPKANARLIAAAPAVLAALKGMLAGVPDGTEVRKAEAIRESQYAAAGAAIAKAEGR